jgi:hypothetical protein
MTITITATFETIADAAEFLSRTGRTDVIASVQPAAPTTFIEAPVGQPEAAAPTPKKRGRPAKVNAETTPNDQPVTAVATVAEPEALVSAPEPIAPAPVQVPVEPAGDLPSTDDAKAALELVFNKHGFQGAQQALNSFGVSKLRDLPAEQYAAFIAAAEAMVAK